MKAARLAKSALPLLVLGAFSLPLGHVLFGEKGDPIRPLRIGAAAGGTHDLGVFHPQKVGCLPQLTASVIDEITACDLRPVFLGGIVPPGASDDAVEVKVDVPGPQGQNAANDFITIRVKVKDARVVQLLYRETIRTSDGQPLLSGYDSRGCKPDPDNPRICYAAGKINGSQGCKPDVDNPHICYDLTTNPKKPNWIVDAQRSDPYYPARNTLIDCDGVTVFDLPTFPEGSANDLQRFTAEDFVISNGQVVSTIHWTLDKPYGFKQSYHDVSVTRLQQPMPLSALRDDFPDALHGFVLEP